MVVMRTFVMLLGCVVVAAFPLCMSSMEDKAKEALSIVPPLLKDLCLLDLDEFYADNVIKKIYKRINGEISVASFCNPGVEYYIKGLCKKKYLSPQAKAQLLHTCSQLTYTPIEANTHVYSSPLDCYDAEREIRNKIELINRAPSIIRDLCLKTYNSFERDKLSSAIFRGEKCFKKKNYIWYIASLVEHENYSPHTIARVSREFEDVLRGITPPAHHLNQQEEEKNKQELVAQFPANLVLQLRSMRSVYNRPSFRVDASMYDVLFHRLLCQAYILSHPSDMRFFLPKFVYWRSISEDDWQQNNRMYVKSVLEDFSDRPTVYSKGIQLIDDSLVRQLADGFIARFDVTKKQ